MRKRLIDSANQDCHRAPVEEGSCAGLITLDSESIYIKCLVDDGISLLVTLTMTFKVHFVDRETPFEPSIPLPLLLPSSESVRRTEQGASRKKVTVRSVDATRSGV